MEFTPGEINIVCSNVATSLRFYSDILGFAATMDDEGFYHLRCGRYQYLLLPIAHSTAEFSAYGAVPQFSMDLMVADIRAAEAYFRECGVPFAQEWVEGEVMFVVRDPDGLPWEIIQSG